ncbi:response regulator transcription factor [Acidisoma sp. S159]|uniref:response regulator transcription factor n=1 Tax=Acidisoma sp. S159 TaxID=1747225 RepID=UPI00131B12D1|nr:response regulator [Acidisoma sp. S159]
MAPSVLVFVVEDEELIRHLLEEALTDGGFAVVMAATGEEAMALLSSEGAKYSALVTDVNLPGKFSGWEVARHAREINAALPVIYMTGASAYEWASQGVPNSQLIPKPFAVAQVVTAVTQLINASANGVPPGPPQ